MKFYYIILLFVSISSYSQSCEELKKINEQLKRENKQLNEDIQERIKELDAFSKENELIRVDINNMHSEMESLLIDLENTIKTAATEKKIHNLSDLCKNYFLNLNISDENFEIIDAKLALDIINTIPTTGELKNIEDFENKNKVFLVSDHLINNVNGKLFLENNKNKNIILNYKFLLLIEESDTLKNKVRKVTWGSGINLQIELSSKEKSISISSLLELTKNDKVDKRYTISQIGLGSEFYKKKYSSGEFTIMTYSEILKEIDTIIRNLSETTKLVPELIAIKY
ncbi:hypothetical protein [Flavobacterium sp. HNIBRBA15423]|uniref:hypothetical protein n=1 Tax=Flavobacterium sp. HNIBRBA15423 TaxID=3458683 RepID=UPI004044E4EF